MSGNTVLLGNPPTTPILTYGAPPPTAGISNAGRAGISNYQPVPSVLPGQTDTVVYYSQPGVLPQATAPATEVTAPATELTEPSPAESGEANPAPASESGGRVVNDLGPSYYGEPGASPSGQSLAQISAEFKARKATTNARMLSNQDVQQMLSSRTGVTVARNMPPLGPGIPAPSGAPENSQEGTNPPGASQPAASQTAQSGTANPANQKGATGQTQAGTPPPVDSTQSQPAGANATAGATTPSVNPNQQSNDARGKSRLPATATFLPLLGLLGLVSGGIGLAFRKFRK
jgi:hypothetical protein